MPRYSDTDHFEPTAFATLKTWHFNISSLSRSQQWNLKPDRITHLLRGAPFPKIIFEPIRDKLLQFLKLANKTPEEIALIYVFRKKN